MNAEFNLLDQFAIAALAGGLGQGEPEKMAELAYQIAEAMVARSKGGAKPSQPSMSAPVPPRAAMTITEFCEASGGISKAFFHKLVRDGKGPRLMKLGHRTLITAEAAAEWRKEMEG